VARRSDPRLALALFALTGAAPPVDGDLPAPAPGFAATLDTGPAPAFAQPRHDAPLDPAIAALVVARLVGLHLLDTAAEAQDAARAAAAIRGFQASIGAKQTGVLDRKTLALMGL
jgi:hypothetical protein